MSQEIIYALISLVSGGGLTALITKLLEFRKQKKESSDKEIDERITAWQQISDKNENRIKQLEQKIEIYDRDIKSLERYMLTLEQMIIKMNPSITLPDRPKLELENGLS